MSIELLQTLSMVSYIVAVVLLLIAIALFFLLDIKKVVGDVSGSTARKAIENIRQQNEAGGDKAYKLRPGNAARVRLTDKISPSGRLKPHEEGYGSLSVTTKLETTQLSAEARRAMEQGSSSETTVLSSGDQTTILSASADGAGETTVLRPEELSFENTANSTPKDENFQIDVEMGFAGSNEIIE